MKTFDQLAAAYREEAAERIAELEAALLQLEERPADDALVDQAFRAMHTIKGSGAMFGFDDVAAFTHEVETIFELVRSGQVPVSRELIRLTLHAKDLIRDLLEGAGAASAPARAHVVAALRALRPGAVPEAAPGTAGPPSVAAPPTPVSGHRVRFQPGPELFLDGTNPLGLLGELRSMGPCQVVADTSAVPPLETLDPERCHLAWEVSLTTQRGADAIRDVFIFVEDHCQLRIEPIEVAPSALPLAPAPAAAAAATAPPNLPPPPTAEPAPAPAPAAGPAPATSAAASPPAASIRVAATKLDRLVDLVGELVIAQARLSRLASLREDAELLAISEDVERLSAELRDGTLDVRMLPIGTTFGRFQRVVHDLAAELGKEVVLETEGADTELDKTVIERLVDPLVHLIRNACDHGLEQPAARVAAGKPARGTVRLSASHSGGSVLIDIQDDGRGLDPERIRAKAVENGEIAPDAQLSEAEIFELIFRPGLSTARSLSSVSGRGVGMDVVKSSVEALRGTVRVESVHGRGTSVHITLPLTLAIIDGLLVTVGEGTYVLPLSSVEECVELTAAEVERGHGSRLAAVRGELIPYLRLREVFDVPGERPAIEELAIVRVDGVRYGLTVDDVVGQHQTVIKSLGRMYRGLRGLSGATILGDGAVALIVDVAALISSIERRKERVA
ncbi:MAG: chemotaxis protein CheA [Anaeromyxobacter sp.]